TGRTDMHVPVLDSRIAALTLRRPVNRAGTRSKGGENRIETVNGFLWSADHQAIAAIEAPDASGGAAINIVDAFGGKRLRAPYVVLEIGVAAVDDDVALGQESCQIANRRLRWRPIRQHDPDGARAFEL